MSQHLDDGGPAARAAALTDALTAWLPEQRWYAGRGRPLAEVVPLSATNLVEPAAGSAEVTASSDESGSWLDQVVVEVRYGDGGPAESYQLFLGYFREVLPDRLAHVHIGRSGGLQAFDGLWDRRLANGILELISADTTLPTGVRFRPEAGATVPTDLPSRVVDAQQSNTSVVYDDTAIMKVFRKVVPGRNPDLELNRALRRAGSQHVPELLGEVGSEAGNGGAPASYAMLSAYAANSAEGWAMATASVRDLFAEADLRADEVGGDFAGEAERLGEAIAAVHADLAATLGTAELDGPGYADLSTGMLDRLTAAIEIVPELAAHAEALRTEFAAVAKLDVPFPVQRIHGDLHLGQVLRTPIRWLVIDFEGEPIKPLSDRLRPDSPLRDVAGMLRSFDYAAAHLLVAAEPGGELSGGGHQLEFRAQEWADRNRKAFCAGYGSAAPVDPMVHATLLRAYELDKAVYETVYETRHRPTWRDIPLRSIAHMLDPD